MSKAEYLPLQIECIHFFESNPFAFETVEGLSTRLGKSPKELEVVLVELETLAIVEKVGLGSNEIYRYVQPVEEVL
ncbi:hypothetical protein [Aquibacillus sediminis]|uniref:hypothetical protein n=1 Tax=Aquibacillus sediminis TaxID=2574734 RepID=UPI001107E2C5|nr:hypothetical protein [Aquibacillus sediminis]